MNSDYHKYRSAMHLKRKEIMKANGTDRVHPNCVVCGKSIVHQSSVSKTCRSLVKKQKSPCRLALDRQLKDASKQTYQSMPKPLIALNQKMRRCLGVGCQDKPDSESMFLSTGPGHRICDRCHNIKGGVYSGSPVKIQKKLDVIVLRAYQIKERAKNEGT